MFEIQSVTKRYLSAPALDRISLSVVRERTLILLGPSGCGKSTLVRLMVGLEKPNTGEIRFDGVDLAKADLNAQRRRMGYVIQGGGLFPHLTARDNVLLLARYLQWPKVRLMDRVEELRALTQLPEDALARYPGNLSGGQVQRVSLMRALMLNPDVLLLDEPLGALDPITRYELQSDLRNIFDRLKKTVVWVTHDLSEAAFFAHRIVLLREGRIVQEGSFQDFVSAPADAFVTRFIRAQRAPLDALGAEG